MNPHLLNKNIHAAEDKNTLPLLWRRRGGGGGGGEGDMANGNCSAWHGTFQKQPRVRIIREKKEIWIHKSQISIIVTHSPLALS